MISVIARGFKGQSKRETACGNLQYGQWYIFKPLPTDHESLVLLLSTIQEMNSRKMNSFEDHPKTSEPFSSTQPNPSSSLQLGSPASQSLPYLPSSSKSQERKRKKKNATVEYILVGEGEAAKIVSAIPCKFGDFIIYLVPAKNIVHFILFMKKKDNPLKPFGFVAKIIKFKKVADVSNKNFLELIDSFNELHKTSKYKYVY